ncbi:Alpha/Beta hydrolase protein [Mycena filopes]|nr:Alpha/Beta hydrolase protein [Mycena filopes]
MDEETRVAHLWFSSDALVLKAEKRLFRVPKSILAARSSVFRDMVAFPQPTDNETGIVEGTTVVLLHDSAVELEAFLTAIFDSSYFMPPPAPVKVEVVVAILRLAHKYDVQYLQRRALEHLSVHFSPASVHDYRKPHTPDHLIYCDNRGRRIVQDIQLILAATEVGAHWLLPVAYVETSGNFRDHLLSAIEDGADAKTVRDCLASQLHLSRASGSIYKFFAIPSEAGCLTPLVCNATRFSELADYFDGCGLEVDLAPIRELDDDSIRWDTSLCGHCLLLAKANHRTMLEALWDRLPAIYGLPAWPELNKLKVTMMGEPTSIFLVYLERLTNNEAFLLLLSFALIAVPFENLNALGGCPHPLHRFRTHMVTTAAGSHPQLGEMTAVLSAQRYSSYGHNPLGEPAPLFKEPLSPQLVLKVFDLTFLLLHRQQLQIETFGRMWPITVLVLVISIPCALTTPLGVGPEVTTESGTLRGFVDSSAPAVRQFLGVPFALPPTGPRRWLPPAPFSNASASVEAKAFGPACPQIPLSKQSTPDIFSALGGNRTEFFPVEEFDEDCLTLNVWTPTHGTALPVLVWFFGGAFLQGGSHSLYFNPESWVQRTQAHIVVSVNFRVSILGFPNAPGLNDQNLSLLDQRAALEWLRANIGSFGGDATRIVSWGESAGAIAVDFLNLAFPADPIVYGSIMQSGTALFPPAFDLSQDTTQANFPQVGALLGCAPGAAQIECMRAVSWQDIEALLGANLTIPNFAPIPDERVVFANYTARYADEAVAGLRRVPALVGTNRHELDAVQAHAPGADVNDALGNATFLCTAAVTARLRQAQGLLTFRYRYDGDFPNISPPANFSGAYHASELPLIFGTAGLFHGPSTPYEDQVSLVLQDLWLNFVRDPQHGLPSVGWESFDAGKAVLLGEVDTPMKVISIEDLDGTCPQ